MVWPVVCLEQLGHVATLVLGIVWRHILKSVINKRRLAGVETSRVLRLLSLVLNSLRTNSTSCRSESSK